MKTIHRAWCFASILLLYLGVSTTTSAGSGGSSNLLLNAGFEVEDGRDSALPAFWEYRSSRYKLSRITGDECRDGERSVQVTAHGYKDAWQALLQDVEVQAGEKYTFSVYVKNNKDDLFAGREMSAAYGQIVIEWFDATGSEVGRDWSESWDHTLSRVRWEQVSIKRAKAPPGAVRALFGIQLFEGPKGAQGSFFVDDASMKAR